MKIMKKVFIWIMVLFVAAFASAQNGREECTSAVVSAEATVNGSPLLWKNRDTGTLSNKIIYVQESPYSYLALVNAEASSGRQTFAGLNAVGFGIMNTVSYNLPKKAGETENLEGIIMADALRTCCTVGDFENYIEANLGPYLGSWANYGVMDALGNAYLYEVHNHGFTKYDAVSVPEKYLINTNYARSGKNGQGAGYLRIERASQLFEKFQGGLIDFRVILTQFTRDIGHVLLKHPSLKDLKHIPPNQDTWIFSRDCINRPSTASAVVMVGRKPSDSSHPATLWIIPGEPLCAIAVPVWVEAGCAPEPLWKGKTAPLWQESLRIKSIIRPYHEGNKEDYIHLNRLDNSAGTGCLQKILEKEKDIMVRTHQFLREKRTPEELASFQDKMAEMALAALKKIR